MELALDPIHEATASRYGSVICTIVTSTSYSKSSHEFLCYFVETDGSTSAQVNGISLALQFFHLVRYKTVLLASRCSRARSASRASKSAQLEDMSKIPPAQRRSRCILDVDLQLAVNPRQVLPRPSTSLHSVLHRAPVLETPAVDAFPSLGQQIHTRRHTLGPSTPSS